MANSFTCATCRETHEGLPTDYGWKLPDVVWAIPEAERATRAKFNSDLCQLGDRFFIRCILKVPFSEQSGYYGWGVWVEVQSPGFDRYVELYALDGRDEPPVDGLIANEVPGYEATLGLPCTVQFQTSTTRPTVNVSIATGHAIAVEQADGISNGRYHEILEVT